jgi:NADPH:quinone reductase-like Zn-dependent oxidoreductase
MQPLSIRMTYECCGQIRFFMRLMPGGLFRPKNKMLGADVAGRVEAIGCNVNQLKPGDEVFGYLPSATGRGTLAEFVCARENLITLKPANLTFEQAAAVPEAAMTALQGLRDYGNIRPGQKVLINGASGGVGTFAVQIAKAFGKIGGQKTHVASLVQSQKDLILLIGRYPPHGNGFTIRSVRRKNVNFKGFSSQSVV